MGGAETNTNCHATIRNLLYSQHSLDRPRLLQTDDYAVLQPFIACPIALFFMTCAALLKTATEKGEQQHAPLHHTRQNGLLDVMCPVVHRT